MADGEEEKPVEEAGAAPEAEAADEASAAGAGSTAEAPAAEAPAPLLNASAAPATALEQFQKASFFPNIAAICFQRQQLRSRC